MPRLLKCLLRAALLWSAVLGASLAAPVEDSMAQRTLACTGCHGAQGRAGPDGFYPRLAGKPEGYLYNQLVNFRNGRRHYALMTGLIDPLSDSYLREIARYFSSLNLPYPPAAPARVGASVLARGQQLVEAGDPALGVPACQQCHGLQLTGVRPNIPGLLGLPADYLNAQLGGWRSGQRKATTPDCMARIASRLSESDVSALAHWLASQALPQPSAPAATLPPKTAATIELACGSAP